MKQLLIFGCICTALNSCTNHHTTQNTAKHTKALFIVADITDKKKIWPKADYLLTQYHFDQTPDSAAWFGLYVISDKAINTTYFNHLPDVSITAKENIQDDPQARAKAVLNFYQQVKVSYREFYKDYDTSKPLPYSQCWATISSALIKLTQNPASDKWLFVYSDISENSPILSVYKRGCLTNPSMIAEKLIKADSIPQRLAGIHVVIVYVPETRYDDARFAVLFNVYKQILEARGATVTLNTSQNSFEL